MANDFVGRAARLGAELQGRQGRVRPAGQSNKLDRACLLKDDIDSTATTIEQYLDDLLFQPLQLLAREAET